MDRERRIILLSLSLITYYLLTERRRRRRRASRRRHERLRLQRELHETFPDDLKNYLCMDSVSFNLLLNMMSNLLRQPNTVIRRAISPKAKLIATLRFLATGSTYKELKSATGISPSALSLIIPKTCKIIYEVLRQEYLKFPKTTEEWLTIAERFENRWKFINCCGALHGKHIKITPPANSYAAFYNHKNFNSSIFLALVDANYKFIYANVGQEGRFSDGRVFEYTKFWQKLNNNELNLPKNTETRQNLNFVFVADQVFALSERILKSYPKSKLDQKKRVFNDRLSRAHSVVENALTIITARFKILQKAIRMKYENMCNVVLSICALHNFLCRRSEIYKTATDLEEPHNGVELVDLQNTMQRNWTTKAKNNRNSYKEYFNSPEGM